MAVLGPTAAGKSELALRLASELEGEILSVDSMQVYRGMDIGTAKPTRLERRRVPHHLIDLVEPEEAFTVADFRRAGKGALGAVANAGRPAVIVGGSGLHFRALVDPMRVPPTDPELRAVLAAHGPAEARRRLLAADPDAGAVVDLANPRRVVRALEVLDLTGRTPTERSASPAARAWSNYQPEVDFVGFGFDPGEALGGRIELRLDAMLGAGLLEEVGRLAGRLGPTASQAVGYKELMPVAAGGLSLGEGRMATLRATHELARRQRTYFRRDPRIRWLPWHDDPEARYQRLRREVAAWTS